MLLMAFSRQAAAEMADKSRVLPESWGNNPSLLSEALVSTGNHSLLREYAERIRFDPAFTIHDRENSADLMNLARHEQRFSTTECRGHLPRHVLTFREHGNVTEQIWTDSSLTDPVGSMS